MKPLLFTLPDYAALAAKIQTKAALAKGEIEYKTFPDGERYLRIASEVRGHDAILMGGTTNDHATLDLFDLAGGLIDGGCRALTLLIPYFSYSTMERRVRSGEVVTAKTRARLLSAIPQAPYGNRVALLDLHSEGIPFYFEGGVMPVHLYAKPLILKVAKKLARQRGKLVMGCVDAGRAKWVESLANDLGVPAAFVYKRRVSGKETKITGVNAPVKGREVVIYDDLIRTGGSVIEAAEAYRSAGASRVSVIATHGIFCGDALERLRASGAISKVICTDSHPMALATAAAKNRQDFLEVISSEPIFTAFLKGGSYEVH